MTQEESVVPQTRRYHLVLESLFVFVLAGLVRLTSLGVFRAIDEEDRWAWAVDFYRALLDGNLAGTLIGDGYPGVFPVWLETIWLFVASIYRSVLQGEWIGEPGIYALIHEWQRWSNLTLQRFPVVLVNTILVVLIFLYTRRLFGRWTGLLAAIFIALDPFYLSDSRVNRAEALLTGLMGVSFLALLVGLRWSNWRHLVLSGIFGGLAWLTKSQSIVLIPILGVISLAWLWGNELKWQTSIRRWLVVMLSWGLVASLTFIILWPAVWTIPQATFDLMYGYATRKAGAAGGNLFFMGQTLVDEDPGLLFYPVVFLFRISPLTLIGLLLGVWMLIRHNYFRRAKNWRSWLDGAGVWALVAYCALYAGGMSLGGHKQDRFLMTIFPMLDILAAIAFVRFAVWRNWPTRRMLMAGGALLVLQLMLVLPYHPYYFTYFNPLVGGGPAAVRVLRVGWGEGMDQVSDYLNTLDEPENLTVSSRFSPYLIGFEGQTFQLDADGEWLQADKIIFYIQQVQRKQDPSPGIIRYFQEHVSPEKVITIDGIDYAWVYPNPVDYPADPRVDRIEGQLALLGYNWNETTDGATVRLVWENLGRKDQPVAVRLSNTNEKHGDWVVCQGLPGFEQAAQTLGEIAESECILTTGDLEAGFYSLQLGLRESDDHVQPLTFVAGQSTVEIDSRGQLHRVEPEVAFAKIADRAIPPSATRLKRGYNNQVRLLAYEVSSAEPFPGESILLTLYWQAPELLTEDAHVSVQAFIGDERIVLLNGPPVHGSRHTKTWQPGEVIKDEWTITLPGDLPAPALIRLDVGLFQPDTLVTWQAHDLTGNHVPGEITRLRLQPVQWPVYTGEHPEDFTFGDAIGLIGYETSKVTGELRTIKLYWKSLAPLNDDYTAFVHLLRPDGSLVVQSDVAPANGRYPVAAWQPGEIVLSVHQLVLPVDLPSGDYTLLVGLYHADNGTRLPVVDGMGTPLPNNAAVIGQISQQE